MTVVMHHDQPIFWVQVLLGPMDPICNTCWRTGER